MSSLAYTLHNDLYWDKIENDSADQVVSRGILYLLIFAQYPLHAVMVTHANPCRLGLMVRWSYGYRYLLAPEDDDKYDEESETDSSDTPRLRRHLTGDTDENTPLIYEQYPLPYHTHRHHYRDHHLPNNHDNLMNGSHSRDTSRSEIPSDYEYSTAGTSPMISSTPFFSADHSAIADDSNEETEDMISFPPPPVRLRRPLTNRIRRFAIIAWREFLEFMNMPLWAMLVAVAVALFPQLQEYLFFREDGFVRGSVIYAIKTLGDVSIPLILVILGANIANEEPPYVEEVPTEPIVERKSALTQRHRALILGVASRMLIVPV